VILPALLAALALAPVAAPPPEYEVLAVRYGTVRGFPLRSLVLGADTAARADLAMMVWVVRGGGRVLLVDAGFHRGEFRTSRRVEDYRLPSEALAPLGIRPEHVTDVILTHLHWDHADGADLFPLATVWVQRAEYEHYARPEHLPQSGVFASDMAMLGAIAAAGRLRLVSGDGVEVAPGVRVYTGGRHTRQSQYVAVPTAAGTVVLASDNAYLYRNLEGRRPIAATWDTVANLAAQDRMRRLAAPGLVVPGHDPAVFERFPAVAPGIARIGPGRARRGRGPVRARRPSGAAPRRAIRPPASPGGAHGRAAASRTGSARRPPTRPSCG
jgi:glyoxylase-like metal-dependent hydrolase (beta-lactamase superfamily II)